MGGERVLPKEEGRCGVSLDERVIDDGLTEMLKDSGVVTLAEGEGKKAVKSQLPAGMLALHNGLGLSPEGYGDFIRVVSEDHGEASEAIQMAFVQACEAVGIPFEAD